MKNEKETFLHKPPNILPFKSTVDPALKDPSI